MAGNKTSSSNSNDKPLWRPLAHKLSSLIPLRRLNKAKSKPDVRSDHAAQSNTASADFRLDVQLNGLESLRLPSSWLLQPKDADKQQQQQPVDASSTRLSHHFSRKPVNRTEVSRPLTFIDSSDADQHQARASALEALSSPDRSTTPSILDRGRPVEARHLIHQPVKNLKNHRKSLPLDLETMFQAPHEDHDSNALRTATIRLVPNESLITTPSTPSVKESPRWTAEREARLAMPPPPRPLSTSPIDSSSTTPSKAIQIPRNPQLALKRPTSLGPPPKPTDSPSEPQTPLSRAPSKRPGALTDRLAWMRKLEEKDTTKPNNDLTALQKRAGSVSDKLAMFEKKNLSVTSSTTKRLQLPARNTSSQYSASVRESIFSADGSAYAPSPRTSMDTARTSSVMSYYDDSFREKLESIVGQEPEAIKSAEE
ncbi:hypothetical protein FVEG_11775 [Fusarium verticillioides 7600]|uniref:Uncharacterized protein n=1 Tax=Gibberella moniliformis (strain M3125 / FGSC 7600) TaxID=334819 RepID=W7MPB9_GIBM7|nr:hypothetical protein FVEG_11775 [Fusarium verticillioides 7600]EWG53313.1 hypothetical protein FVEG_11775 [Fusarium verticillioides 7600]RBQ92272.1 hypothetical protein FVER53263_11775 [Fusarium verticillioides]